MDFFHSFQDACTRSAKLALVSSDLLTDHEIAHSYLGSIYDIRDWEDLTESQLDVLVEAALRFPEAVQVVIRDAVASTIENGVEVATCLGDQISEAEKRRRIPHQLNYSGRLLDRLNSAFKEV